MDPHPRDTRPLGRHRPTRRTIGVALVLAAACCALAILLAIRPPCAERERLTIGGVHLADRCGAR